MTIRAAELLGWWWHCVKGRELPIHTIPAEFDRIVHDGLWYKPVIIVDAARCHRHEALSR